MTIEELKQRVSIQDVASSIGYEWDKSKGKRAGGWWTFVLRDSLSHKMDEIIIRPDRMRYITRYSEKGSVYDFILHRLSHWPDIDGKDDNAKVWKVLETFSAEGRRPIRETIAMEGEKLPFRFWEWTREKADTCVTDFLCGERKISRETVSDFSSVGAVCKVRKARSRNEFLTAFPYREMNDWRIVNYEMRGMRDNRSIFLFAEGGNRSTAFWSACFSPIDTAQDIYLFESAIDAMSFYEIRKMHRKSNAVLISFGGTPAAGQIEALAVGLRCWQKVHLCFDNDLAGNRFALLLASRLSMQQMQIAQMPESGSIVISLGDERHEYTPGKLDAVKVLEDMPKLSSRGRMDIIRSTLKDWNDDLKEMKRPKAAEITASKTLFHQNHPSHEDGMEM